VFISRSAKSRCTSSLEPRRRCGNYMYYKACTCHSEVALPRARTRSFPLVTQSSEARRQGHVPSIHYPLRVKSRGQARSGASVACKRFHACLYLAYEPCAYLHMVAGGSSNCLPIRSYPRGGCEGVLIWSFVRAYHFLTKTRKSQSRAHGKLAPVGRRRPGRYGCCVYMTSHLSRELA
jgi:hypothetical protein